MRLPSIKRMKALMLPGIKRWIALILIGMVVIGDGVLLVMGKHPIDTLLNFVRDALRDITHNVLAYSVSGVIAISFGVLIIGAALIKLVQDVLKAYLPEDRESIPDVLY